MKKIMTLLSGLMLLAAVPAAADNDKAVTLDQLPRTAKEFIADYFPGEKAAYAKLERDFPESRYEVVFTSASKLEFKRNGEWTKISCRYSAVPEDVVPPQVTAKVLELFPGAVIIEIERDRRETDIKLDNRREMKFDRRFNLIEIDD